MFSLGLVVSLGGATGCQDQETAPPPVFQRPSGGSGGEVGEGGAAGDTGSGGRASVCTSKKRGCACEEVGSTTPCTETEVFGDYVTCTTGVLTCGDDLIWGPCIGERTTQPASLQSEETGKRAN